MVRAVKRAPQRMVGRLLLVAAVVLLMPEPVAAGDDHRCAGAACVASSGASSSARMSTLWHSEGMGGGDVLHGSHANAHLGVETVREPWGVARSRPKRSRDRDRFPASPLVGGIYRPPRLR